MDFRRLRAGEWILAAAGLLLLASLLLPWYSTVDGTTQTAFEALTVLDIVLALIAVAAVSALPVTAAQRVPAVPLALEGMISLAGIVALILVLIRVLALPDGADGREWALWLALGSAGGVVLGGFVAMRDERRSEPGRHVDLSGRPAPEPPEIDPIPLARNEGR